MSDFYVIMRHGSKAYPNNSEKEYRLDAPLTDKGEAYVMKKAQILKTSSKGRKFDLIVSSPYRRTRQTAQIAAKVLGVKRVVVCTLFSEYLGNQKTVTDEDFTPTTLKYNPVRNEDVSLFETRTRDAGYAMMNKYGPGTVVVTHSFNIKLLSKFFTRKTIVNPIEGRFYRLRLSDDKQLDVSKSQRFYFRSSETFRPGETKSVCPGITINIPPTHYGVLTNDDGLNERGLHFAPITIRYDSGEFSITISNTSRDQVTVKMFDHLGTITYYSLNDV